MFNVDKDYQKKVFQSWKPVLEAGGKIENTDVAMSTAMVLENAQNSLLKSGHMLKENTMGASLGAGQPLGTTAQMQAANNDTRVANSIIPLTRRIFPELIGHEICGVQTMNAPLGYAYALRHKYGRQGAGGAAGSTDGKELGYNFVDAAHTGADVAEDRSALYGTAAVGAQAGDLDAAVTATPALQDYLNAFSQEAGATFGSKGVGLGSSEFWDVDGVNGNMPMINFALEKASVEAKTRKLAAHWTPEMAEDLQNMHGLDVVSEMSDMLSYEISAGLDRQMIEECVKASLLGTAGKHFSTWDATSADGRHQLERIQTLHTHIVMKSQQMAINNRRGGATFAVSDAQTCGLLERMGDYDGVAGVSVDKIGVSKVGTIRKGAVKLFRDTLATPAAGEGYILLGYKGANKYDAGVIWCPYIPMQIVQDVSDTDLTPRIAARTRYGVLSNLFGAADFYHMIRVTGLAGTLDGVGAKVFIA